MLSTGSLAIRAENLNYLIMRKYYAKTVHPELLNDLSFVISDIYVVGPCHHGMARPQVADRGTASDKEGSCE